MEIRIVAFNNAEVYAAIGTVGDYCIISLNDSQEIEIGDILSGVFDSSEDYHKDIYNVTKKLKINIHLENWGCSCNTAINDLLHLGSPSIVFTETNSFMTDADDVISNLRREICGL